MRASRPDVDETLRYTDSLAGTKDRTEQYAV